jgi:nitrate reductase assembly molybdenum cofactor insertion protein NarJ
MTAVIGAATRRSYPREMASPDDVQRLAAALKRPRAGYVKRLNTVQIGLTSKSGEAARQLGLFVDRIGDLSLDELGELYVETFERSDLSGTTPLVTRLARSPVSGEEARMALRELAPTLEQLNHERNPFVYVVRALCCLLLARVNNSRTQHS